MNKLNSEYAILRELREIMVTAYNLSELRLLVFDYLEMSLDMITGTDKGKEFIILDLIEYSQRYQLLDKLVAGAYEMRQNNKGLEKVAAAFIKLQPGELEEEGDTPAEEKIPDRQHAVDDSGRQTAGQPPATEWKKPESNQYERLMGLDTNVPVRYLELGSLSARAVGRIHISQGVGYGCGFMVSPRLLLTCNHILGDTATAAASVVEFDLQLGVDGQVLQVQRFDFAPDDFFVTNKALDFTLVGVKPVNAEDRAVAGYGWLPLMASEQKVVPGQWVNIIHHPRAAQKQVAFRGSFVSDILPNHIHYQTDTAPGSAGAPVMNNEWQVIALHHARVPRTDEDGKYLTVDGKNWENTMPMSVVDWKAKEGVRISSIVRHLDDVSANFSSQAARLYVEFSAQR